jgi:hypothetical protein
MCRKSEMASIMSIKYGSMKWYSENEALYSEEIFWLITAMKLREMANGNEKWLKWLILLLAF